MEAFDVQNRDAPPADLNKAGLLEGALDQIDGGSLDAKHLSEKFLRQPDVIASQPFTALEKPPCCAQLDEVPGRQSIAALVRAGTNRTAQ
jgi:hypothetical protein